MFFQFLSKAVKCVAGRVFFINRASFQIYLEVFFRKFPFSLDTIASLSFCLLACKANFEMLQVTRSSVLPLGQKRLFLSRKRCQLLIVLEMVQSDFFSLNFFWLYLFLVISVSIFLFPSLSAKLALYRK